MSKLGTSSAFLGAKENPEVANGPHLVANNKATGSDLLSVIRTQLKSCDSFDFCVAFVGESGLQPLVDVFADLRARGVRGRLLTSTYLNFNSPDTFNKLLEYDNIEVRVYQGNLHAKGYVFDSGDTGTVIVGSSNLTQMALTCNKEWNVLFRSYDASEMLVSIRKEFGELWNSSLTAPLTRPWVAEYAEYRKTNETRSRAKKAFSLDLVENVQVKDSEQPSLKPNKMQELALAALAKLHEREEPRALLVSATGTGKTYLSAFDVATVRPERVLFLVHRKRILTASLNSYRKLLGDRYSYGIYKPGSCEERPTCLFAMCSTMALHLDVFRKDEFDYIIIDEAHRVGSSGYRKIIDYFTPKFYLGMTATPTRTDGFDVFQLFNHVIAFQITLQDALANDMLAPFHYFGIADLEIDDGVSDDIQLFNRLTSDERVKHIVSKIDEYTVKKSRRCGLIFCSRNDEAAELSLKLNECGLRTRAISGANTDAERDDAIAKLEAGEYEYLLSVDIMNEGVDIPSLNQIIMLRRTESAIVFVQQLGRGLRKAPGKEYTLVLDFIGNYQQNFFVPIALSGDRTYNKDNLRAIVSEGSAAIPGCSTVTFDEVSKARIYKAIDGGDFSGARLIRDEYCTLRNMLGRVPRLDDFDANGAIDPLRIFKKFGSYHAFLSKYEPEYNVSFSPDQETILEFVSRKLASGKRVEDLLVLKQLIGDCSQRQNPLGIRSVVVHGEYASAALMRSVGALLSGAFGASGKFVPLIERTGEKMRLSTALETALANDEFKAQLLEVLDFALSRNASLYANTYEDTNLVLNAKYTYEEVCCLLGWDKNVNAQNIGGYKYDSKTNTYPVFINYEKDQGISDSTKYEDRFVSPTRLVAISKSGRKLDSVDIKRLKAWPENGMKTYLFLRKNKDDGDGGKEFYFLGEMHPAQKYAPITIAGKSAVEITYDLDVPVEPSLFEYFTSSIEKVEAD